MPLAAESDPPVHESDSVMMVLRVWCELDLWIAQTVTCLAFRPAALVAQWHTFLIDRAAMKRCTNPEISGSNL